VIAVIAAAGAAAGAEQQRAAASAAKGIEPDLEPTDELAVVRMWRPVYGGGAGVPWPVLVDGEPAGPLRLGERCQFYVHPGRHRIEIRVGAWNVRDSQVVFAATAGEVVLLRCGLEESRGLLLRRAVVFERLGQGRVVGNRPASA
jgi:hypothetical protein